MSLAYICIMFYCFYVYNYQFYNISYGTVLHIDMSKLLASAVTGVETEGLITDRTQIGLCLLRISRERIFPLLPFVL